MSKAKADDDSGQLTIVREFDAPKKHVFNAFAEPDALAAWWGPVECKNTVLSLDFREGGVFHYKMEKGGKVNYGRFLYRSIRPYDLLEFVNSFSDARGNIVKAPFDILLPTEILYRLMFTERDGKTTVTLTGTPVNATQDEVRNFRSINKSVEAGFGGTFDRLSAYLEQNRIN